MLRGLFGIRHKVSSVSLHRLGEHLHSRHALQGSFHLRDRSTKHRLWVWLQHHILSVMHLAYFKYHTIYHATIANIANRDPPHPKARR